MFRIMHIHPRFPGWRATLPNVYVSPTCDQYEMRGRGWAGCGDRYGRDAEREEWERCRDRDGLGCGDRDGRDAETGMG